MGDIFWQLVGWTLFVGFICFCILLWHRLYIDNQQQEAITEKIKEMKGDKMTIADLAVYKKVFFDNKDNEK